MYPSLLLSARRTSGNEDSSSEGCNLLEEGCEGDEERSSVEPDDEEDGDDRYDGADTIAEKHVEELEEKKGRDEDGGLNITPHLFVGLIEIVPKRGGGQNGWRMSDGMGDGMGDGIGG